MKIFNFINRFRPKNQSVNLTEGFDRAVKQIILNFETSKELLDDDEFEK